MTWDAAPTAKRGRQRDCGDTAITTCLPLKVLFGMALRRAIRLVESLPRLIGLDWAEPDFSTLSRRETPLKANFPYRVVANRMRSCACLSTAPESRLKARVTPASIAGRSAAPHA